MKYGILGTGNVSQTIGSKLIQLGHEVKLGSRNPNNEAGLNWVKKNGNKASLGTFSDAASFGEIIFNCVQGIHSIEALKLSGPENLKNKILIDLSNPFIYKDGHISLDPKYSTNTSLGEEIQKFLPETKIVKTLNYLGFNLMTNPSELAEPITGFYCGNDEKAKEVVNNICATNNLPITQRNFVARELMEEFLAEAKAEQEFIDIEKALDKAIKMLV